MHFGKGWRKDLRGGQSFSRIRIEAGISWGSRSRADHGDTGREGRMGGWGSQTMVLQQATNMPLLWCRTPWWTYLHHQAWCHGSSGFHQGSTTFCWSCYSGFSSHHISSSQTSPPPLLVNAEAQAQLTDLAPTPGTAPTLDLPAFDWSDDAASIPIIPIFPKNQPHCDLSALHTTNPNPCSSLAC